MDQNYFLLWKVFYNYSVHDKEIFLDSITTALEIGISNFDQFLIQVNNHLHLLSVKDIMSLKKTGDRITQQQLPMSDEESMQREDKYWNGCIQRNWTVIHSDYQRRVNKGIATFINLFCGLDNMADFQRLIRRVSVDNEDDLIRHDDIRLLSHLFTLVVPYTLRIIRKYKYLAASMNDKFAPRERLYKEKQTGVIQCD
ncbi:hypothetical protein PRIPAC_75512 [Pristionchus pacificus]|uniref:Uncharacterized protein n=1 Tax=Pristionchus pacificus TaxID=54126 RepID=A0A2A6CA61_PRIPA|nr:hypothetical protein PRIPAC_75512 [Pristionchus pacificus]|eukprot:PDM74943.1 hypothetical protein PRIPAC_40324 [Pristionchus pacificus]